MRLVPNPVLPGCHPDPSVVRVGADYFMVTSTFAYHPGIPVHHSRDLVSWRLVGHVLEGDSWLPLEGNTVSHGVWAPTIRHHDGVFYVVVTIVRGTEGAITYVTTAVDPAGPWAVPTPLEADGIDPSLFFDHDGRAWFTAARDAIAPDATGPGEIWLRELDLGTLTLVGPTHVLWHGALTRQWVEAPHIYERDGRYHLIGAEGGTERNHAVTAATSDTVTGPYSTDPRSPLLTHRHLGAGCRECCTGCRTPPPGRRTGCRCAAPYPPTWWTTRSRSVRGPRRSRDARCRRSSRGARTCTASSSRRWSRRTG